MVAGCFLQAAVNQVATVAAEAALVLSQVQRCWFLPEAELLVVLQRSLGPATDRGLQTAEIVVAVQTVRMLAE